VIRSKLAFKKIPNRMIVEVINFVVVWLNAFPPSSGISDTFSPRTIMAGSALGYKNHCKFPFGAYSKTHEDNIQTDTMVECTRCAIFIGPNTNFQGSYKFICIRTGKMIIRKQLKEVSMSVSFIKAVESLANQDKQIGAIVFTDCLGNGITDTGNA
jgi:hypothetical protein